MRLQRGQGKSAVFAGINRVTHMTIDSGDIRSHKMGATLGNTMNLRAFSLFLVLAFVLLAAFASLNWNAMAAPSTLRIGFAEVSAPIGMVMLAFTALISGFFILYIVLLQAGTILESRRLMKEVKAQRELADTAEASRFTELRSVLEGELRKIEAQGAASNRAFSARVEQSEREMQDRLSDATGSLSAHLGEIEDKLDRALVPGHPLSVSPRAP
jgi:predicted lipid-binding transport protein (Tim44 family)